MPDLISGFNQKMRKQVFHFNHEHEAPEHREIFAGIKRHYRVDALFHQSSFFKENSDLIHQKIKEASLPSVRFRTYFFAHVFLELMLDRLLSKHYPEFSVKIREEFSRVETGVVASYFSHIQKSGELTHFFDNFSKFNSGAHLHFYTDNDFFIGALIRVYQKITPVSVSISEKETLKVLAENIENDYRGQLLSVFDQMRFWLNDEALTKTLK